MSELQAFFQLADQYQLSGTQWALAVLAGLITGFSKSGIKGISIIVVTLLALIFGGKTSTGILLPMLTMGDIFAVWYYRRHAQWKLLFQLLPWMMAGVLVGVWVGKDLPEQLFKQGMAVIILGSVAMMYWWENKKNRSVPDQWWFAGLMGSGAGFTTMVGNLAGAFSNVYFLAMRLPKNEFIGTAAWLFFIINLFKLPFHVFVWETVSWQSFSLNVRLFPALALGLFLGVKLVEQIKEKAYRHMILILTALGALLILLR